MKQLPLFLLNACLILTGYIIITATLAAADTYSTLVMALLPIPDSLPSYVAQEKGYFRDYGITVKHLPVVSAIERDQLMQAGRIDGMLNELAVTASFNRDNVRIQIVATARSPLGTSPLFTVLAAPQNGIRTIQDLKQVPIAVSKNTVIEYITDQLLSDAGLSENDIVTRSVPVLPERMQLLLSGQIQAATLPEPLTSSALKAGAKRIADDLSKPEISLSVLSFSVTSLTEKKATIQAYINAWMKAARDLNENPDAYRELMHKKIRVPGNVKKEFKIPPFPIHQLPTQTQWNNVMAWMVQKTLLRHGIPYAESVNGNFIK